MPSADPFERAFALLGRICAATEGLDFTVTCGLIASLPGDHDASEEIQTHKHAAGTMLTANMGLSAKIDHFERLAELVLEGEDKAELKRLAGRARSAAKNRNARVHSMWMGLDAPLAVRRRRGGKQPGVLEIMGEVSESQLMEDVESIGATDRDLRDFLLKHRLTLHAPPLPPTEDH